MSGGHVGIDLIKRLAALRSSQIRISTVVSICACHVHDPGSIPGFGAPFLVFDTDLVWTVEYRVLGKSIFCKKLGEIGFSTRTMVYLAHPWFALGILASRDNLTAPRHVHDPGSIPGFGALFCATSVRSHKSSMYKFATSRVSLLVASHERTVRPTAVIFSSILVCILLDNVVEKIITDDHPWLAKTSASCRRFASNFVMMTISAANKHSKLKSTP